MGQPSRQGSALFSVRLELWRSTGARHGHVLRRLVAPDLARPETAAHVDGIFDLGSSGGSDIASQKDSMIAEAFHSTRRKLRRR